MVVNNLVGLQVHIILTEIVVIAVAGSRVGLDGISDRTVRK